MSEATTIESLKKMAEMHPRFRERVLPAEIEEVVSAESVQSYYEAIGEAMALEKNDALRYGHENPVWTELDDAISDFRKRYPVGVIVVVVFGGTRSSKTEWRAKRTVEAMLENPDYQTWACHSTQESSREAQQKKIYKYIPPEFKPESGRFRQGKSAKVVYTPWGGFTENVLSFPSNKGGTSECHFKFYGMDPRSLRGAEINDGWMDEESSIEWLDELIARATTRNGIVYLTFQAGNGVTPLVSSIIGGARTVKEVPATLLPLRKGEGKTSNVQRPTSNVEFQREPNAETAFAQEPHNGSSGVTQSRPFPARAVKRVESAGANEETNPCGPGNQSAAAQPASTSEEQSKIENRNSTFEMVPRIQENLEMMIATGETGEKKRKARALIFYFHTSDNVYGNPESQVASLEGASREKILADFYGVPTKTVETQFPLFRESRHVVSLNLFREIQKGGGTWYQFLDPCSGRNWFCIWVFVDPSGRRFVAAEFPSYGHEWAYVPGIGMPEPWALPGDAKDGQKGGGQKEWGWGYRQYLEEMARVEAVLAGGENLTADYADGTDGKRAKWESYEDLTSRHGATIEVRERWIDARYGNARKTDEENPTTLIIDLHELGMDFLAAPSEKAINSGRGGGDGSLRMINDMLFYDQARADEEGGLNPTNTPGLFVVETCPNVIYALQNWTGADGQKGACKDPIDVLRMLALTDVGYVDTAQQQVRVHQHFVRR